MDVSFIDWKVVTTLFQTIVGVVLAIVIYNLWHKQKEKEVIANEAKDIILKMNTALYTIHDISSYRLNESTSDGEILELIDLLTKAKLLSMEIRESVQFLYSQS